ncbi:Lysosomal acid phosphatase [Hondaea fermentalgiana]|uniref:Lysosomal acid phosphatase n=1 Tax=Hondaea fermentalgiana TaxID=2315210 RepID=A0A2R5GKT6_9STRA|nr:Lysosomal acid phosphatase [Hondaea fermentalgiana]|eukprot:GBG28484.1 Lysosomal acid phosphatase [Hondaea fermentalgiana]
MTLLWMSTFRMLSPRATFARALVLTACVAACAVAAANQLEAEAVVFFHRHGDRSPTALMPRDEANNKRWTEMGLGMLTPQGMAQLEALGSAFRKRYVLGEPFQVLSPSYKHVGLRAVSITKNSLYRLQSCQVVSRFQVMADRPVTVPTQPTPKTPRLNDRTGTKVPIAHYSAHDSTLIALLGALGAFDDENPPYGSTVVFELLRDSTEINGERPLLLQTLPSAHVHKSSWV